jgi:hypothetical protein
MVDRNLEIVALKAEMNKLQKKIEALEAPERADAAPVAKQLEDRGVRIETFAPQPAARPKPEECDKLFENIANRFPVLRPKFEGRWADEEKRWYRDGFRVCFSFISTLSRTERLCTKLDIGYWSSLAQQHAHSLGVNCRVGAGPLIAAAIANGDVDYAFGNYWPYSMALAVAPFGGPGRAPSPDAWRQVLAGKIREPLGLDPAPQGYLPGRVVMNGIGVPAGYAR